MNNLSNALIPTKIFWGNVFGDLWEGILGLLLGTSGCLVSHLSLGSTILLVLGSTGYIFPFLYRNLLILRLIRASSSSSPEFNVSGKIISKTEGPLPANPHGSINPTGSPSTYPYKFESPPAKPNGTLKLGLVSESI